MRSVLLDAFRAAKERQGGDAVAAWAEITADPEISRVAGVAECNIVPILLEGLKRLEYRGYDSAGLAVNHDGTIDRCRAVGKVASLVSKAGAENIHGKIGRTHV